MALSILQSAVVYRTTVEQVTVLSAVGPLIRMVSKIPGAYSLVVNPLLRRITFSAESGRDSKVNDVHFRLDLNDYTQRRAWCGVFENGEIRFVRRVLASGGLAVDVGSNIGLLTIPMAIAVGDSGKVIAIDPIPSNLEALKENAELNHLRNIETILAAVGNSDTPLRFSNLHHSADTSTGFYRRVSDGEGIAAGQIKLGSFLPDHVGREVIVDLLKIDVEGMELEVLLGLADLLTPDRIRSIMFEVFIDRKGVTKDGNEVIRMLTDAGFVVHRIKRDGHIGKPVRLDRDLRVSLPTAVNLVATA